MLVIDPNKRLGMPEIIKHKWIQMVSEEDDNFQKLIDEYNIETEAETDPLNDTVLGHMEGLRIDRQKTLTVCPMDLILLDTCFLLDYLNKDYAL